MQLLNALPNEIRVYPPLQMRLNSVKTHFFLPEILCLTHLSILVTTNHLKTSGYT